MVDYTNLRDKVQDSLKNLPLYGWVKTLWTFPAVFVGVEYGGDEGNYVCTFHLQGTVCNPSLLRETSLAVLDSVSLVPRKSLISVSTQFWKSVDVGQYGHCTHPSAKSKATNESAAASQTVPGESATASVVPQARTVRLMWSLW